MTISIPLVEAVPGKKKNQIVLKGRSIWVIHCFSDAVSFMPIRDAGGFKLRGEDLKKVIKLLKTVGTEEIISRKPIKIIK